MAFPYVPFFNKIAMFPFSSPVPLFQSGTFDVEFNNLQSTSSNSLVGDYTITGGTKAYDGEVGSGHVQVTWTGNRSLGKVTEIYS